MRHTIFGAGLALVSALSWGGCASDDDGSEGTFVCPADAPADGAPCTPPPSASAWATAHCSWGDDPRPACRTTAVCSTDGSWAVTTPSCTGPALPAACPSPAPDSGTVCSDASLGCWYDDGRRCRCSSCQGGTQYPVCQPIDPPEWACFSPRAGCPPVIPQAGDPCSTPNLDCGPNCELEVVCPDGVWVWLRGDCPICAAPTTPIATPSGARAIADLRVGDLVYSVDGEAIEAVPILRVASTPVAHHQVMSVTLDNGAVLQMSPGHPTADGRSFAELAAGSSLDGQHQIRHVEVIPYTYARTYDILPDSDTGAYFAAGALVGSTLR